MVHLEEVEDRDLVREQPGPYEEDDDEADYTDTGILPFPSRALLLHALPLYPSLSLTPLYLIDLPIRANRNIKPDSSLSADDDDDFPSSLSASETALDRIYALKDMISPSTRRKIASTSSSVFNTLKSTALFSGKGLYILSTGGLMVLVPYMMAMVEEQQIQDAEREQKAREMGNEIMSPGAQAAGMPGKPAL